MTSSAGEKVLAYFPYRSQVDDIYRLLDSRDTRLIRRYHSRIAGPERKMTEINYRAGVAETSPQYVTESLEHMMAHRFQGAVLSWNIMEAPDAHIACLGK